MDFFHKYQIVYYFIKFDHLLFFFTLPKLKLLINLN